MTIANILQLVLVAILPFLYVSLGESISEILRKGSPKAKPIVRGVPAEAAVLFVCGLLAHTIAVFVLKCVGAHWAFAVVFPFVLILFEGRYRRIFEPIGIESSLNFVLWFFVVTGLGLSLFWVIKGVQTGWINNYGDLTYHMGLISSFTLGENFPPEYPIFPGERLTYPFLVNVWSSALWWISPGLRALSLIFAWQWTVLWIAVFFLLRGHKFWLLPWALLFAGGSYAALAEKSSTLIQTGIPWTVLIDTVWVTQRTALPGVVALIAAAYLVFTNNQQSGEDSEDGEVFEQSYLHRVRLAGCIIGAMPLVHTHLFLVAAVGLGVFLFVPALEVVKFFSRRIALGVGAVVAGLSLLVLGASESLRREGEPLSSVLTVLEGVLSTVSSLPELVVGVAIHPTIIRLLIIYLAIVFTARSIQSNLQNSSETANSLQALKRFRALLPGLSIAFIAFPWIVGKQHGAQFITGWVTGKYKMLHGINRVRMAAMVFAQHAGQYLVVFVAFWFLLRKHLLASVLVALFIVANFIQLAFWEWDQLKIFIGLLALLLVGWSSSEKRSAQWGHLLFVITVGPAIFLSSKTFVEGKGHTVYSEKDVEQSMFIRSELPPDAIIAAKPDHNSLVTLTGRRMYSGYAGTLSSHGIANYQDRSNLNKNLEQLLSEIPKIQDDGGVVPQYVLWTDREKRYWKRKKVLAELDKQKVDFLYAIPDASTR